MRRPDLTCFVSLVALLIVGGAGGPAGAIGYWNLPGSFCQCAGYGWGAGYHASLVLGPITWDDCCAHNEVRLPYAPAPSCGYGGCSGCGYSDCGYSDCGCSFGAPTMLAPAPMPAALPAPTPAASPAALPVRAPIRALFDAPVEP